MPLAAHLHLHRTCTAPRSADSPHLHRTCTAPALTLCGPRLGRLTEVLVPNDRHMHNQNASAPPRLSGVTRDSCITINQSPCEARALLPTPFYSHALARRGQSRRDDDTPEDRAYTLAATLVATSHTTYHQ